MHQSFELGLVQGQARGDEADVEACGAGTAHKVNNVGPRERLPTGEVGLKRASFRSFFENAHPDFRGKFVGTRLQFERIRAVNTVKRAAMREFSNESKRVGRCNGHEQSDEPRLEPFLHENDCRESSGDK